MQFCLNQSRVERGECEAHASESPHTNVPQISPTFSSALQPAIGRTTEDLDREVIGFAGLAHARHLVGDAAITPLAAVTSAAAAARASESGALPSP